MIKGKDHLQYSTVLDDRYKWGVKSEFTLNLTNVEQEVYDRLCNGTLPADECADEMELTGLGKDWTEILKHFYGNENEVETEAEVVVEQESEPEEKDHELCGNDEEETLNALNEIKDKHTDYFTREVSIIITVNYSCGCL